MSNNLAALLGGTGGLLGPVGSALGGGLGGAIGADQSRTHAGLGGGAGGGLGALAGGAAGGLGGGALGLLLAKLLDKDSEDYGVYGLGIGGALGSVLGGGLGARAGADFENLSEKNSHAQDNNMHREKLAYAVGAVEKLAEQQIDPSAFVQVAIETRDPGLCKIAEAIVALDEFVKTAGKGEFATELGDLFGDALQKLRKNAPVHEGITRGTRDVEMPGGAAWRPGKGSGLETGAHGGGSGGPMVPSQTALEGAGDEGGMSPALMAALGIGGAGTAGVGVHHAAGDANTMENKLRRALSNLPGVDLDTQSRAGAALEGLGIG